MVAEIIFHINIFDLMWYQHVNEGGAWSGKTSALTKFGRLDYATWLASQAGLIETKTVDRSKLPAPQKQHGSMIQLDHVGKSTEHLGR